METISISVNVDYEIHTLEFAHDGNNDDEAVLIAAEEFCSEHGLNDNIQGLACISVVESELRRLLSGGVHWTSQLGQVCSLSNDFWNLIFIKCAAAQVLL